MSCPESCESRAKKMARVIIWPTIRLDRGPRRFCLDDRLLYLAGPDSGDANVTGFLGNRSELQLAVDRDPDAIAVHREKHPRVATFHGDIAEVPGCFDIVFADFYSNLAGPDFVHGMQGAFRCVSRDGAEAWLVVAMLKGRERSVSTRWDIQTRASVRKRAIRQEIRRRERQGSSGLTLRGAPASIDVLGDGVFTGTARLKAVSEALSPIAVERRMLFALKFQLTYVNERTKSPMLVAGYKVTPCSEREPFRQFAERWERTRKIGTATIIDVPPVSMDHILDAAEEYDRRGWPDVHRLFNFTKGEWAAHKAVRTRRKRMGAPS